MPDTSPVTGRVLFLQDTLMWGGASRGLIEILKHFDRRRFDLEVATLWDEGPLASEVRALGIPVHEIGISRKAVFAGVGAIVSLVRERGVDLVHTARPSAGVAGRAAAFRAGVPAVSHVVLLRPDRALDRTVLALGGRIPSRRGRLLALSYATAPLARRFVAPSHAAAARPFGLPSFLRGRIRVVYRGQDHRALTELAHAPPSEPAPVPGRPWIVAVSQLTAAKGLDHLIDAMPAILLRWPEARLTVVGDGPHRSLLEARARPLGGSVAFAGFRRDRLSILARSDVAAFPSLAESFGTALVEALVLGKASVASDIPAFREVTAAGRAALLVRPEDPASLAAGVLELLGDPGRSRRLSAAARERSLVFDARTTTAQIMAIWEEVIATGRSRRDRRPAGQTWGGSGVGDGAA